MIRDPWDRNPPAVRQLLVQMCRENCLLTGGSEFPLLAVFEDMSK